MIADLLGGVALELLPGPVLLLCGVVVLLVAGAVVVDQWYRWRVRRAQRRVVQACERAAAKRVAVPGQRAESD